MIFRNTFRLLLSNFSNVWKVLLYYLICIVFTLGVCWGIASPIIAKLSEANVFNDLVTFLNSLLYKPSGIVTSLNDIMTNFWNVVTSNTQFRFNYVFLIVWISFVFPFTLDLAQLALGEVMYGFMSSKVKYGFTGRFIKNIGKSCVYSLMRFLVLLPFNVIICLALYGMVKIAMLGSFLYVLLDVVIFSLLICLIALKHTLFCCWMPDIAVIDQNVFKALGQNFKCVFRKFLNIFSNCLTLVLTAFVFNALFFMFSFSVALVLTLPITAVVFVCFQMVSFFSSQGMRYYVYQDMFIVPKKFEEQEKIKKLKYLV